MSCNLGYHKSDANSRQCEPSLRVICIQSRDESNVLGFDLRQGLFMCEMPKHYWAFVTWELPGGENWGMLWLAGHTKTVFSGSSCGAVKRNFSAKSLYK